MNSGGCSVQRSNVMEVNEVIFLLVLIELMQPAAPVTLFVC